MLDSRIKKLAQTIVHYSVAVQAGEKVVIRGPSLATPLIAELYRAVIQAKAHPLLVWQDEVFDEIMLREGSSEQLSYRPDLLTAIMQTYHCVIDVRGANNTRYLATIDPEKQEQFFSVTPEIAAIQQKRIRKNELRAVSTYFPTDAYAQNAGMSRTEFADMAYRACFADLDDPIAAWQQQSQKQKKLIQWLKDKQEVRIQGPNADLRLSIAGRSFLNLDGHLMMPDGELLTAPVEDSIHGWIRYTYPANLLGREVMGITFRFEAGKVVEAEAAYNDPFLQQMLNTDAGSRYIGEFSLPMNYNIHQYSKIGRFDGKMGGTTHLAIGSSWPGTGGKNRSAVHWDMIYDMRQDGGQLWIDDELFIDGGQLLFEF